jgi:hypothetical protein
LRGCQRSACDLDSHIILCWCGAASRRLVLCAVFERPSLDLIVSDGRGCRILWSSRAHPTQSGARVFDLSFPPRGHCLCRKSPYASRSPLMVPVAGPMPRNRFWVLAQFWWSCTPVSALLSRRRSYPRYLGTPLRRYVVEGVGPRIGFDVVEQSPSHANCVAIIVLGVWHVSARWLRDKKHSNDGAKAAAQKL